MKGYNNIDFLGDNKFLIFVSLVIYSWCKLFEIKCLYLNFFVF